MPRTVRSVYTGQAGLLKFGMRPNSVMIDASTIDPATAKACLQSQRSGPL